MPTQARRSGRPRVAVLSRELILETALKLLDERGEKGAGMRDIARELEVRPSALYNHVSGQDDIVAGIRELVSDRIDVSGFEAISGASDAAGNGDTAGAGDAEGAEDAADWQSAIRAWAWSYRGAFAAHPPTIALLATARLVPGSRTSRMYDAVCRGMMRAGWPEAQTLEVIVALESFILGAALDHVAPSDMLDPGDDPNVPTFRAAFEARDQTNPAEASFELGLDAMLAGLTTLYDRVKDTHA